MSRGAGNGFLDLEDKLDGSLHQLRGDCAHLLAK